MCFRLSLLTGRHFISTSYFNKGKIQVIKLWEVLGCKFCKISFYLKCLDSLQFEIFENPFVKYFENICDKYFENVFCEIYWEYFCKISFYLRQSAVWNIWEHFYKIFWEYLCKIFRGYLWQICWNNWEYFCKISFYLRSPASLQSEIWQLWSLFAPLSWMNRANFSQISNFSTCLQTRWSYSMLDISGTLPIVFCSYLLFLYQLSIYGLFYFRAGMETKENLFNRYLVSWKNLPFFEPLKFTFH